MSTRQDKSSLDHSFLLKDGSVQQEELNLVSNHLIATVHSSFVEERKGSKRILQRQCPICMAKIGHFGTNFKRHVNVCCPLVYDDVFQKTGGEYFSSLKNMKRHGVFDREWKKSDEAVIQNILQKIKNVQPSVSRKKRTERKKKSSRKELKRLEKLNKQRLMDSEAEVARLNEEDENGTKHVLASSESLWYNSSFKYLNQQIGETYAMLSAEPDNAKELILKQMDLYPFSNDNLRTVLKDQHTDEYLENCAHLNAIFETRLEPEEKAKESRYQKDPAIWKSITTLDAEIRELHTKIQQAEKPPASVNGSAPVKRKREHDTATDPQSLPKRPRLDTEHLVRIGR